MAAPEKKKTQHFQIDKMVIHTGNIQCINKKNVTLIWVRLLRRNDNSWMNMVLKPKLVDSQTNGYHHPSIWIHLMDKELLITKLRESCTYLWVYLDCHKINVKQFTETNLCAILWASGLWQYVVGSGSNVLYEQPVSIFCRRWQHAHLRCWYLDARLYMMFFHVVYFTVLPYHDYTASNGRADKQWIGKGFWNKW
jgi:hypothetical protein